MIRILFIVLGTISLALGVIGIFLPLLPTTPFLLLTAYLYLKSSDRLYEKLISHPRLGAYILDFQEHKAIPLRVKCVSISMLWATILISAFVFVENIWVRCLLIFIAIAVTIHILSFATKEENKQKNSE